MLKNVPALKAKQLIRLLEQWGCRFYREGKGDHRLYVRYSGKQKRVAPIDMGQKNFSQAYIIRILRQFGFSDDDIDQMLGQ